MNIEIRNYKIVHGHDDSNPFTGKLYIDNKHVADLYDDGWGGDIHVTVRNQPLFDQADKEIRAKNEVYIDMSKHGSPNLMMNIYYLIDKLADAEAKKAFDKKDNARMKRYFKKYICVGVPGANSFRTFVPKKPVDSYTVDQLKVVVANIKTRLEPGEQILNDNLKGVS